MLWSWLLGDFPIKTSSDQAAVPASADRAIPREIDARAFLSTSPAGFTATTTRTLLQPFLLVTATLPPDT